jgi:hypothetical protein
VLPDGVTLTLSLGTDNFPESLLGLACCKTCYLDTSAGYVRCFLEEVLHEGLFSSRTYGFADGINRVW